MFPMTLKTSLLIWNAIQLTGSYMTENIVVNGLSCLKRNISLVTFTCTKSRKEALEKGVKYVQS